jgi:hypothetical protein
MDEARRVLERLERIETLDRSAAPPRLVLEEVRALLSEAEEWVRAERGGADLAEQALRRCRAAIHEPRREEAM